MRGEELLARGREAEVDRKIRAYQQRILWDEYNCRRRDGEDISPTQFWDSHREWNWKNNR